MIIDAKNLILGRIATVPKYMSFGDILCSVYNKPPPDVPQLWLIITYKPSRQ